MASERLTQASTQACTAAVETDAIVDSGLSLEVAPASTTLPGLRLQYAERGQRLFQSEDLRLLAELRRLFDEIRRYRGLLEEGVQLLLGPVYSTSVEAAAPMARACSRPAASRLRCVVQSPKRKRAGSPFPGARAWRMMAMVLG